MYTAMPWKWIDRSRLHLHCWDHRYCLAHTRSHMCRVNACPPALDADQLLEEAAQGIERSFRKPCIVPAGPAGAVVIQQKVDLGCGFERV